MSDPSLAGFALCIVAIVISVQRSKKKLKTALYSAVCTPVAVILFGIALGSLIPSMNTEAVGRGAVDISFFAAALVGLVHSRLTQPKVEQKTPTPLH